MAKTLQAPNGSFIADAKMPGQNSDILAGDRLGTWAGTDFHFALIAGGRVIEEVRLPGWLSLIESIGSGQMLFGQASVSIQAMSAEKCCRDDKFQLSNLISAHAEAGAVIAFDEQARAAKLCRESRPSFKRSGQVSQRYTRGGSS